LPESTANALFIFPKTLTGKESTLPMAVLTQELLLHAERCMRHDDVSKNIMLAGLNRMLDEWLCDSFVELIEEIELWKWDDTTGDFWSRLAKALQQSNMSVTWSKQLDSRLASVHTTDASRLASVHTTDATSSKFSVLAPRCSRALWHNLQLTSDRCLGFARHLATRMISAIASFLAFYVSKGRAGRSNTFLRTLCFHFAVT